MSKEKKEKSSFLGWLTGGKKKKKDEDGYSVNDDHRSQTSEARSERSHQSNRSSASHNPFSFLFGSGNSVREPSSSQSVNSSQVGGSERVSLSFSNKRPRLFNYFE